MLSTDVYVSLDTFYLTLLMTSFYGVIRDAVGTGNVYALLSVAVFCLYGLHEICLLHWHFHNSSKHKIARIHDQNIKAICRALSKFLWEGGSAESVDATVKQSEGIVTRLLTIQTEYVSELLCLFWLEVGKLTVGVAAVGIISFFFFESETEDHGSGRASMSVMLAFVVLFTLLDGLRLLFLFLDVQSGIALDVERVTSSEDFLRIEMYLQESKTKMLPEGSCVDEVEETGDDCEMATVGGGTEKSRDTIVQEALETITKQYDRLCRSTPTRNSNAFASLCSSFKLNLKGRNQEEWPPGGGLSSSSEKSLSDRQPPCSCWGRKAETQSLHISSNLSTTGTFGLPH
uniref:Uncharacterized protein n=1 Tax=Chromera velia CCMP2878 TaxID=1169474 RepID=A0A0G4GS11_9ALVE|eukprot:Cvel_5118.t1-p1 / transcript=Cvel_5118.t1 / gene=Cvel_5118 / organism=Chromera_velia_CCMP2878 / gene_product=hypothetical protein / transcript_product=hypothetical protein / location=Cvel_scaffold234:32475-33506(+) / protein_length=344 / sequence_SO=supercontig / SO=protein_coding / is_pseudo=false